MDNDACNAQLKKLKSTNSALTQAVWDNLEEMENLKNELVNYEKDWLKDRLNFCCPELFSYVAFDGDECKKGDKEVSRLKAAQDHSCCSFIESTCEPGTNYEDISQLCCGLHKVICCSYLD